MLHGGFAATGYEKGFDAILDRLPDTDAVTQLENPNPFVNVARALAGHNEELPSAAGRWQAREGKSANFSSAHVRRQKGTYAYRTSTVQCFGRTQAERHRLCSGMGWTRTDRRAQEGVWNH